MNNYESIIIAVPTLDQKKQKAIENKYKKLINKNGELEEVKNLGSKRLAYKVKNNDYGIYFDIYFKSEPEFIQELEKQYRIDDEVLKFICIRRED